ncbi:COG4315 family predicted lipoprotein [Hoyosella altamirensis]|uniref:Putative lipoprotein with Yx(FWY)xxD motif n=1 Tax=Hoyosella altamirensis TaxID=616997 RepID=A0A839RK14_9ACTN|nr:hypothetical protein [Hoyosella altamirensis]MBB3036747.1 putative lipoprotein with Yx(FWY)xxD motif [Hoyosella altamirensis]
MSRLAAVALAAVLLSGCSGSGDTGAVTGADRPAVTEASLVADEEPAEDAETGDTGDTGEAGQASPSEPVLAKTEGPLQVFEGTAPAGAENAVSLISTPNGQIGTYLSDEEGFTLYRFDNDTTNPPASNCAGECAETWPRVLLNWPASVYVEGVDPDLVSYIELENGDCQLTLNNWPVYYFANDREPGDVNGHGVGDVWFAIAPGGGKAQAS